MTFTHDGNKTYFGSLVNFEKMVRMHDTQIYLWNSQSNHTQIMFGNSAYMFEIIDQKLHGTVHALQKTMHIFNNNVHISSQGLVALYV